jgi:penicillin-binding protein 1A
MARADDSSPRPRGKQKGKRSWLFRLVMLGIILLLPVLAAGGALVGIFLYYGSDPHLPTLKGVGDFHPEQIVRVLDRDGNPMGEIGSVHRTVVPYDKIPKIMIKALLAAEDAEYFEHEGIDFKGMVRAFIENVIRRKFAQGASTITQQVVKQLLLTQEKTMRRKVQEIILARRLTQRFSKEEVLAIYLNQMYFGHGRYGVEEAARYYFGKSVADVDIGEAALLAGLLQSPERLSPYKHPNAAKQRQIYVLGQMVKLDYIYEDVAKQLAAAPIAVIPEGSGQPTVAPEAVDVVRKQLEERYGAGKLSSLGFDVKTTIDWKLQLLARQALEHGLAEIDQRHNYCGPLAHLSGRAVDKKRGDLTAERKKPLAEGDKVDGIVEKVEKIGRILRTSG